MIPKKLAIIPIINKATIIRIGDMFFLSNLQIPSVRSTGTRPGISEFRLSCKVVTFIGSRASGPSFS